MTASPTPYLDDEFPGHPAQRANKYKTQKNHNHPLSLVQGLLCIFVFILPQFLKHQDKVQLKGRSCWT